MNGKEGDGQAAIDATTNVSFNYCPSVIWPRNNFEANEDYIRKKRRTEKMIVWLFWFNVFSANVKIEINRNTLLYDTSKSKAFYVY